ncbi:MAG TPA: SpoVA/SpoVAEb family sporulation membrane protein [Lachnospiraceae bacterium]|nr:SpoVA/SpoVAEb family sporulation membrane protein [Lachnospiraceae bacterium]
MKQENEEVITKKDQLEYQAYIKQITPAKSLPWQMCKAFLTGGLICLLGEGILKFATNVMAMDKEMAGSWCSLLLVLIAIILTGLGVYSKLVDWGGAGALVPITGFANGVASPAIEYKKEGQIYGIGCKIFTIAGPVILYGILTSWVLGLCYWIGKAMGIL